LAAMAVAERLAERGGAEWAVRADPTMVTRSGLEQVLENPSGLLLAGTFLGVTVGVARAHAEELVDGRVVAVVDELYVLEGARGVGVGEALLTAIIDWAEESGHSDVEGVALPGNREAKNLFERFGLVARAIVVQKRLGT
jgi:GNAT superfamily N-acetyltransferase